jgi:DNA primase
MGVAAFAIAPGSRMSRVSDEKLQELHDRVDIVAVVQRRVQLKKSGHDWKGLCPFHGEKTPSFYVVPDKKFFTCFGCGAKGDAIKFLMQLEGKSFREALEALAQEAGISLEPEDPEEARRSARRAALAEVNEKACKFYEQILWEHPLGKVAREHLEKRGVSQETAKKWRLGYAPNRWDSLAKSLEKKKVDPKLVEEAGADHPHPRGGAHPRLRRAAPGGRERREVPQLAGHAAVREGVGAVRAQHGA